MSTVLSVAFIATAFVVLFWLVIACIISQYNSRKRLERQLHLYNAETNVHCAMLFVRADRHGMYERLTAVNCAIIAIRHYILSNEPMSRVNAGIAVCTHLLKYTAWTTTTSEEYVEQAVKTLANLQKLHEQVTNTYTTVCLSINLQVLIDTIDGMRYMLLSRLSEAALNDKLAQAYK